MGEQLFNEMLESVTQMDEILRDERMPSRKAYVVPEPAGNHPSATASTEPNA